jgi:hypothetical protein
MRRPCSLLMRENHKATRLIPILLNLAHIPHHDKAKSKLTSVRDNGQRVRLLRSQVQRWFLGLVAISH